MIGGDPVVRRDSLPDQIERRLRAAVLQRDHAEKMQAVELARELRHRGAERAA